MTIIISIMTPSTRHAQSNIYHFSVPQNNSVQLLSRLLVNSSERFWLLLQLLSMDWHLRSHTTESPINTELLVPQSTSDLLIILCKCFEQGKAGRDAPVPSNEPTLCILSQGTFWPLLPSSAQTFLFLPIFREPTCQPGSTFVLYVLTWLALRTPFSLQVALSPMSYKCLLTSSIACINRKQHLLSSIPVWLPYRATNPQTATHGSFLLESPGHRKIYLAEMLQS